MRKIRLFMAVMLSMLSAMAVGVLLTGCESDSAAECDHNFEWVVKTPATCAAEGTEVERCTKCQTERETRAIAKTTHEFEWVEVTPSTCVTAGTEQEQCKNCKATGETRAKALVAHTPDEEKGIQIDEAAGTHYYECSVCGEAIAPEAHKKGEEPKIDAAAGTHYYECTVCQARVDEAAHDFEWKTTKETSCAEAGSKTQECTVCGAEGETEDIEPLDHTPGTEVKYDENSHWVECTVCHGKVNENTHVWSKNYTYDKDNTHYRTCDQEGCEAKSVEQCVPSTSTWTCDAEQKVHYHKCRLCSGGRLDVTPCQVDETKWSIRNDTYHARVCSVCKGTVDKANHTKVEYTLKEATCSSKGILSYYCSVCEADENLAEYLQRETSRRTDIEMKPHTPEIDWTGSEEGHYHKCSVCNQPADAVITHTPGTAWEKDVSFHWHKCSVCQYDLEKTQHNFEGKDACECGQPKPSDFVTKEEDYTFEEIEGGLKITAYNGSDAQIKLPATAQSGKTVLEIGSKAFQNKTTISKVEIPDGYTKIGDYAFDGCTGLASIVIPATVTNIAQYAFQNTGLTSIELQEGLTTIGRMAFKDSVNLTGTIKLPSSLTSLGDYAFPLAKTFIFAENTTETVHGSSSTYVFGKGTSISCDVETVIFPSTLTKIGQYMFQTTTTGSGVNKKTQITLPNLKYLCYNGTVQEWKEKNITLATGNDGMLAFPFYFFSEKGEAGTWKYDESGEIVVTPYDTVFTFTRTEFYGGWTVVSYTGEGGSVTIPAEFAGLSVKILGTNLFYNKTEVTAIEIPEGIIEIDGSAIRNTGIKTLHVPDSVVTLQTSFNFAANKELTEVTGMKGVTSLPVQCFSDDTALISVAIPSVTAFKKQVFCRCSLLSSITLANNVTELADNVFEDCVSLGEISIPSGITTLGQYLFKGCKLLEKVIVPDSVTKMNYYTFSGCTGLKYVVLPANLTTVPNGTFQNCSALEWIVLPGKLAASSSTVSSGSFSGATVKEFYFRGTSAEWDTLLSKCNNLKMFCNQKKPQVYYLSSESIENGWHWNADQTAPELWQPAAAAASLPLNITHEGEEILVKKFVF